MCSIAAIIPAYNEEKTIGSVISAVKEVDLIDYIIVISDGSNDNTALIAGLYEGVEVIELSDNIGKSKALLKAVEMTKSDILLFLDADLIGITSKHITDLLLPIICDDSDMTIGVFNNGRVITDIAQMVTPYLSGQRALKRKIIEDIAHIDITRFGIEMAITQYVSKSNIDVLEVILDNVTHVMKEEKMGIVKGFRERIKMYWDIIKFVSRKNLINIDK